jgi:hypothetical protein
MNIKTYLPVPIHCDNSYAIQTAVNPVFHEKTKHFEIELFFLREKVSAGVVRTINVKFVDNVAHIFTKCCVQEHNKFCDMFGLYDMYRAELKGNVQSTNLIIGLWTIYGTMVKVQGLTGNISLLLCCLLDVVYVILLLQGLLM